MLFFHQYRCCFVRYCGPTMHSSQGVPQIHPKVDHLQKKLFSHHSNCIRLSYCVQTSISDLFPLRQRRDNSPIPSSSIRQLLIESLTLCRFLGTVSPNFARKSLSAHSFGLFQASHCHLGPFSRGVYSEKSDCLVLPKKQVVLRKTGKNRHVSGLKTGQKPMKEQS